jgi:hypothetical protein
MTVARPNKNKFTPDAEGEWFGSNRGIYIGQAVMELAVERGYKGRTKRYYRDTGKYETIRPYDESQDPEDYHYWWTCAEEYLQKLVPDGYWIGASEQGDYGMWKVEEEE